MWGNTWSTGSQISRSPSFCPFLTSFTVNPPSMLIFLCCSKKTRRAPFSGIYDKSFPRTRGCAQTTLPSVWSCPSAAWVKAAARPGAPRVRSAVCLQILLWKYEPSDAADLWGSAPRWTESPGTWDNETRLPRWFWMVQWKNRILPNELRGGQKVLESLLLQFSSDLWFIWIQHQLRFRSNSSQRQHFLSNTSGCFDSYSEVTKACSFIALTTSSNLIFVVLLQPW